MRKCSRLMGMVVGILALSASAGWMDGWKWNVDNTWQYKVADTVVIPDLYGTTVQYGTKIFDYSQNSGIAYIFAINDTGTAGYGADSIRCIHGIQPGMKIFVGGIWDTAWGPLVVCDSVDSMSHIVTTQTRVQMSADGSLGNIWNIEDTLSISGYAVQYVAVNKIDWPIQFYRHWAAGLAGMRVTKQVKNRIFPACVRYRHANPWAKWTNQ